MSYIHPTAIIHDHVTLGKNVRVEAYAVIGSPPEHRDHLQDPGLPVHIGDNCVIREYVTINSGTIRPTVVGSNCILLRGSHVGHDAELRDNVTLSCNALIGGHAVIMDHANIGLGAVVRQHLIVGAGVMLGMNACATKNLESFTTYAGVPAKIIGQNVIGLQRCGLYDDEVARLHLEYLSLCKNQA